MFCQVGIVALSFYGQKRELQKKRKISPQNEKNKTTDIDESNFDICFNGEGLDEKVVEEKLDTQTIEKIKELTKGEKIFDVNLGKQTVIQNLDIYAKVGKAQALDEYVEFEIRNKQVYYQNKNCGKALDGENLVINFMKGKRDNPKINAILLIKGTLKDTDYS